MAGTMKITDFWDVCLYVCLGQSTDLLETWFVHHAIRGHPILVLSNILSLTIPVLQSKELAMYRDTKSLSSKYVTVLLFSFIHCTS